MVRVLGKLTEGMRAGELTLLSHMPAAAIGREGLPPFLSKTVELTLVI